MITIWWQDTVGWHITQLISQPTLQRLQGECAASSRSFLRSSDEQDVCKDERKEGRHERDVGIISGDYDIFSFIHGSITCAHQSLHLFPPRMMSNHLVIYGNVLTYYIHMDKSYITPFTLKLTDHFWILECEILIINISRKPILCDPSRQKGHVVGKHCFEIQASKVREI